MKLMRLLLLTAIVVGTWTPLVLGGPFDPVAAHDQLLTEATGYFKHAGGTGGQGGSVYYVTNLNDGGSGSLRDALTRTEALIVLFEDGLNGTINLSSAISVRSNKTVWGRHRDGSAADIFVHPTNRSAAFRVTKGKNIIFANLKGDAPGPNDSAPDFIQIGGNGAIVWVHHITVIGDGTGDMDGFVDINGDASDPYVTLSWNRVEDWDNVHGLRANARVTLHHNYLLNSAGRLPKVTDDVDAHVYNNWVKNWGYACIRTEDRGEALVENNIFEAGSDKGAIEGRWNGSGNVFMNGASASGKSSIFTIPYSYTLDPTGTTAEQQALRDRLDAEAGWQSRIGTTSPPPDTTPPAPPTGLRVQ